MQADQCTLGLHDIKMGFNEWVSRKEIGMYVINIRNIIHSICVFIITVANSNVVFVSSQK